MRYYLMFDVNVQELVEVINCYSNQQEDFSLAQRKERWSYRIVVRLLKEWTNSMELGSHVCW
jgi:hypothetical protein